MAPELLARGCAHCEGSLEGKRPHAVYCSRRCKTAASDQRRLADGRAHRRDRARYPREAEHRRSYARDRGREIREQAVTHYGIECQDCSSAERLELDHVHGNGEAHRDHVGHGDAFFRYLLNHDFPSECESGGEYELQVLCRSCHAEKTRRERLKRG